MKDQTSPKSILKNENIEKKEYGEEKKLKVP